MSNPQLKSALESVSKELIHAEAEGYKSCAPLTTDLRIVLDAFDRLSLDMQGLVLVYCDLIKADGDLHFWAKNLTATIRPASKGRAFVSKEAADKLLGAVQKYGQADDSARRQEAIEVQAEPISTTTKTDTTI